MKKKVTSAKKAPEKKPAKKVLKKTPGVKHYHKILHDAAREPHIFTDDENQVFEEESYQEMLHNAANPGRVKEHEPEEVAE